MRTNLQPSQPQPQPAENSQVFRGRYRNRYRPQRPEFVQVTKVTVELHERSVRLRFPSKPADHERKFLTGNDWSWSRGGFWYARRNPENEAFAYGVAVNGFPAPAVEQFAGAEI